MTVKTHVFTHSSGAQDLLCVYPDGKMTLAYRPSSFGSWGPPVDEDLWYRDSDPRPIEEVETILAEHFKEVR